MSPAAWLMKAEPDSRIVKGQDVRFSVDDFERMQISKWDGVRNHEACKTMRERMKAGDKVLFYHSNTKIPGIAAFAEVAKEGYPDYTAWDPDHPYFDPKTDKEQPKWYMVDVRFVSRADHFVPLSLLKNLATLSDPPFDLPYLTGAHISAIKNMALLGRGRLSVQPVQDSVALEAIELLAAKGGWEDGLSGGKKVTEKSETGEKEGEKEEREGNEGEAVKPRKSRKRKVEEGSAAKPEGTRRSARLKRD